jgi:hypothetical protein
VAGSFKGIEMKKLLFILGMVSMLSACDGTDHRTSYQIERDTQERSLKQMAQSIGMPAITNFSEKRMMKDVLELRDKMQPTFTYLVGANNQLTLLCNSVGYGLPYATQYTDPKYADPNGLYTPASADGTWVLCLNPKTKAVEPQYVEPRVIVMTYPLQ